MRTGCISINLKPARIHSDTLLGVFHSPRIPCHLSKHQTAIAQDSGNLSMVLRDAQGNLNRVKCKSRYIPLLSRLLGTILNFQISTTHTSSMFGEVYVSVLLTTWPLRRSTSMLHIMEYCLIQNTIVSYLSKVTYLIIIDWQFLQRKLLGHLRNSKTDDRNKVQWNLGNMFLTNLEAALYSAKSRITLYYKNYLYFHTEHVSIRFYLACCTVALNRSL